MGKPRIARFAEAQGQIDRGLVFHLGPMIRSDIRLADTAPRARPGKLWTVLQFPMTRVVLAPLPLVAVMVATELLIVLPGLAAGGWTSSLIALAGGLMGVAVYAGYVRWLERRALTGLGGAAATGEIGGGFAIGIGLFVVTAGLLVVIGVGRVDAGDGLAAVAPWLLWVAGTAISEEVLFRGVLFRILEEQLGPWLALPLSAALFGGMHAVADN